MIAFRPLAALSFAFVVASTSIAAQARPSRIYASVGALDSTVDVYSGRAQVVVKDIPLLEIGRFALVVPRWVCLLNSPCDLVFLKRSHEWIALPATVRQRHGLKSDSSEIAWLRTQYEATWEVAVVTARDTVRRKWTLDSLTNFERIERGGSSGISADVVEADTELTQALLVARELHIRRRDRTLVGVPETDVVEIPEASVWLKSLQATHARINAKRHP